MTKSFKENFMVSYQDLLNRYSEYICDCFPDEVLNRAINGRQGAELCLRAIENLEKEKGLLIYERTLLLEVHERDIRVIGRKAGRKLNG